MITVRASTVDSFRLYMDPDVDFISVDEMESRLRGEGSSSPQAELGTAWHAAIASEYFGPLCFDPDSLARARRGLDGALSEVSGSAIVDVGGTPVRITGHADWLLGLDMVEHKSSEKPIAPDKYADSMQWRCYVLIFGVQRITYRLAQLAFDQQDIVFAKSIEDVVMYAYPKLREDVTTCLRSLLNFAEVRGCLDAMEIPE